MWAEWLAALHTVVDRAAELLMSSVVVPLIFVMCTVYYVGLVYVDGNLTVEISKAGPSEIGVDIARTTKKTIAISCNCRATKHDLR